MSTAESLCGVSWRHAACCRAKFTILFSPSFGGFNEGKLAYSPTLSGLQQGGEISCTRLTDSPPHPCGALNIHNKACIQCTRGKTEESFTSSCPKATARCLYSPSLRGRETSLLYRKLIAKPRPERIEEMPFIYPSKSQLHLMSLPLLLAAAYISSILMAHGRRHRGT